MTQDELWRRIQRALDAGRDPRRESGVREALAVHPRVADELARLEGRLALLAGSEVGVRTGRARRRAVAAAAVVVAVGALAWRATAVALRAAGAQQTRDALADGSSVASVERARPTAPGPAQRVAALDSPPPPRASAVLSLRVQVDEASSATGRTRRVIDGVAVERQERALPGGARATVESFRVLGGDS
jgi:hypothetical protein